MARKTPDNLDPAEAPPTPRRRSSTLRGVIPSNPVDIKPPTFGTPPKRALPVRPRRLAIPRPRPKVKPPVSQQVEEGSAEDTGRATSLGVAPQGFGKEPIFSGRYSLQKEQIVQFTTSSDIVGICEDVKGDVAESGERTTLLGVAPANPDSQPISSSTTSQKTPVYAPPSGRVPTAVREGLISHEEYYGEPELESEQDEEDEDANDPGRETLYGVGPGNIDPQLATTEQSPEIVETMPSPSTGRPPESYDTPLVTVVEEIADEDSVDDEGDRRTATDFFTAYSLRQRVEEQPASWIEEKVAKPNLKGNRSVPSMRKPTVDEDVDEDEAPQSTREFHVNAWELQFSGFAYDFKPLKDAEIDHTIVDPEFELLGDLKRFRGLIGVNFTRLAGEGYNLPFLHLDDDGKLIVEIVSARKSDIDSLSDKTEEMAQIYKFLKTVEYGETRFNHVMEVLKFSYLFLEAILAADFGEKPDFEKVSKLPDDVFDAIDFEPRAVEECKEMVCEEWQKSRDPGIRTLVDFVNEIGANLYDFLNNMSPIFDNQEAWQEMFKKEVNKRAKLMAVAKKEDVLNDKELVCFTDNDADPEIISKRIAECSWAIKGQTENVFDGILQAE